MKARQKVKEINASVQYNNLDSKMFRSNITFELVKITEQDKKDNIFKSILAYKRYELSKIRFLYTFIIFTDHSFTNLEIYYLHNSTWIFFSSYEYMQRNREYFSIFFSRTLKHFRYNMKHKICPK